MHARVIARTRVYLIKLYSEIAMKAARNARRIADFSLLDKFSRFPPISILRISISCSSLGPQVRRACIRIIGDS